MADAADKAVDCQRKGAAVRHKRDDDNDKANGRLEEKIKGKNHFLFSIYLSLDALSFTGKEFQRSIFIIIRTK